MMTISHSMSFRGLLIRSLLLIATSLFAGSFQCISVQAQWSTNGTNVYYNSGNVGIGTNNPSELLHVFKSAASGSLILVESGSSSNGAQAAFRGKNDTGNLVQMGIYGSGMSAYGAIGTGESYLYGTQSLTLMSDNANGIIKFAPGGNVERMRITANGSVGVGTATPNTVGTLELGQFGYKGFHFLNSGGGARLTVTGAGNAATDFIDSSAAANQRWFLLQNISGKAYYRGVSDTGAVNYELMTFDLSNGRVGIGTPSPATSLHVAASSADAVTRVAQFYQPGLSTTNNYSFISIGKANSADQAAAFGFLMNSAGNDSAFMTVAGDDPAAGTGLFVRKGGNVGIGTATPTEKLHVAGNGKITGNLTVDGNIAAKYQDVAEWVPSSEQVAPGTVVVLDQTKSNQVVPSKEPYDTRVAGVVSERPGLELGERGADKVLVATTGRVLVKVDASQGPIHIGDLLVTSDIPGVAMKSEPVQVGKRMMHLPGTLIGKALEPLEKGSGKILVLLSLQ